MRLFQILALSSLLSTPAFAADLGTYRPGSPYHSVIAQGADICENQCAGDAQCRGWNYVKVNPRAPGVCEFNSKPANPIESSISISGQGAALYAPNVSVGSTNTIRVGTSTQATKRPTVRQASPTRRVVRQPVPQQIRPAQTVVRRPVQNGSLMAQQNLHRQSTGHVAQQDPRLLQNKQLQQNALQQRQLQNTQLRQNALQQRALQQQQAALSQNGNVSPRLLRDPRITNQRASQVPQFQYNLDEGRPPIGVPISRNTGPVRPQAALPTGSVNDPVTHQNAPSRIRQAELAAAQRAAQARQSQNLTLENAQQSLFGSLNDDVKSPRPLVNLPVNPDAPIATAQSRPTIAVSEEPLGTLAGG